MRKFVLWALIVTSVIDFGMSYLTLKYLAVNNIEVEGNLMIRKLALEYNLEIAFLAITVIAGMVFFLIYKLWNWRPKGWRAYWLVRGYAYFMLTGKTIAIPCNCYSIYIIISYLGG